MNTPNIFNGAGILILCLLLLITPELQAQTQLEIVSIPGINNGVDIANAGDERLFVVERQGVIKIIDENENVMSVPFLDISDRVWFNQESEAGLLSMAFDPQYTDNGYFYVFYTGTGFHPIVARFETSDDANIALPDSEKIVFEVPGSFSLVHFGGDLEFGWKNDLLISMGDYNRPRDVSQDPESFFGKILRIRLNDDGPYSIPNENPFYEHPTFRPEIWSLGLRNPWRIHFDAEEEILYVTDVGQNSFEEINIELDGETGGQNYGWKCYESFLQNNDDCIDSTNLTFPTFEYPHSSAPQCTGSIIGGLVYRGEEIEDLKGKYIYGDFCNGTIHALEHNNGEDVNNELLLESQGLFLTSFGQDNEGEMYITVASGNTIYKLVPKVTNVIEQSSFSLNIRPNPTDKFLEVTSDDPIKRVTIYDLTGTLMYDVSMDQKNLRLDLGHLNAGCYFLKADLDDRQHVVKFIKY